MENNYFVDGDWFEDYADAKDFADIMLEHDGRYRVVFTKAERDATINHEEECGK